ncbi:hypothetical protein CGK05_24210, partial [Vibrio parahaemolyticus]
MKVNLTQFIHTVYRVIMSSQTSIYYPRNTTFAQSVEHLHWFTTKLTKLEFVCGVNATTVRKVALLTWSLVILAVVI